MKKKFIAQPVTSARGRGLASAGRGINWKVFKLKEYAQWYKLANDEELDAFGYTREDVDISQELPRNCQYLGTVIINDRVSEEDAEILSDYGYDFLCAVKTPSDVKLLAPYGNGRFQEVSVNEIQTLLK